jgi:hypothetical protein
MLWTEALKLKIQRHIYRSKHRLLYWRPWEDVSARINGIPVAIEVQLSVLSLETVARRTAEYAKKSVFVLWLTQWPPFLDADRYSPEALGEPPPISACSVQSNDSR